MNFTREDIRAMKGIDLPPDQLNALLEGKSKMLPLIAELVQDHFADASKKGGPWVVTIPEYHPPKLNQLMGGHWSKAARLKKACTAKIRRAMAEAGVPVATGKRRIGITIYVSGSGRRPDPDGILKSTLDALKHAGTIIDDDSKRCEWTQPQILNGEKRTVITIEDIES